jgi:hypothetical protein
MPKEPTAFTDGSVSVLETHVDPAAYFDAIYREAGGDASRVPWARSRPNPMLVSWLNAEAAGRVRPGARAVVVGCGLGDDVVELVNRGYDVTGFDLSPAAIDWARKRFPDLANCFCTGDVLNIPSRFRHRFDLVVEISTIQSVEPALRERMAEGISQLACPRGLILTIARGRDEGELLEHVQGPPYPLTPGELIGLFEARGWQPTRPIDDFFDDETPPKRRLRGTFAHA